MIHHLTIRVKDLDRAKAFYAAALAPLGYKVLMEFPGFTGLGAHGPDLWLAQYEQCTPMHVAFASPSREIVHAFHAAALAAGGADNGAPGPRPDYGPEYYGAFVLDPEGNNIEAVIVGQPEQAKAAPAAKKKAAAPAKKKAAAPKAKKAAPKKKAPAKKKRR
jgi:catechol 2,3-dioxygenase-like lactoylglutathione lyase family enzyme